MPKVMLVEDDNNLSEIYQARMQAEGYQIVAAHDGEEALAVAAKEKPDVIISDVMMPKISGFEMLDILRNTEGLKNVKVIMLTALGQAEDQTRADKLGADRYLIKSQVTLEDIVKATQELLAGDTASAEASSANGSQTTTPTASAAPEMPAPAPMPAASKPLEPVMPVANTVAPATPSVPVMPAVAPMPVAAAPQSVPVAPAPSASQPATPVIQMPAATADSLPVPPPAPTPAPVVPAPAVPPVPQETPNFIPPAPEAAPITPTPAFPDFTPPPAAPSAPPVVTLNPGESTPTSEASPTPPPLDDQVMNDAINKLLASTGEPVPPAPVEPAPAPNSALPTPTDKPAGDSGDDEGTHKKVIQPISDPADRPNLEKLLAAEEAKSVPHFGVVSSETPTSNAPTLPTPAPTQPNQPPHEPGATVTPQPQQPTSTAFDPNSISL